MKLSHLDNKGNAEMVDVSEKNETLRIARAMAIVEFSKETYNIVKTGNSKKGDILGVAKIAGIMAAKKTSSLIPLCHPLLINKIDVSFKYIDTSNEIHITSTVSVNGKTGVEMEALVAANIAALTIYDMSKAIDKNIKIKEVKLIEKSGGKSGHFKRLEL